MQHKTTSHCGIAVQNRIAFCTRTFIIAICISISIGLKAQTGQLFFTSEIKQPKDSVQRFLLINNLEKFLLNSADTTNVLSAQKNETAILLGELKRMAEIQKNDHSLQAYLQNVIPIGNNEYAVQVAFMGIDNGKPYLQALFDIIASKTDNRFLFSKPLAKNTREWNTIIDGYLTAYYQSETDKEFATRYVKGTREMDEKLGVSHPTAYYFCQSCETLPQLLNLSGIQYQKEYTGQNWLMMQFNTPEKQFNFYPKRFFHNRTADLHDAFHGRASIAIAREKQNREMICGCACLYYGSWQISWHDIQKIFKTNMKYDSKTDWLQLYYNRYNFGENNQRQLLITQFINALIIEKVEREQGFGAVMRLLSSGDMHKSRTQFFEVLNAVVGINEKNFNKKIKILLDEAMQKQAEDE